MIMVNWQRKHWFAIFILMIVTECTVQAAPYPNDPKEGRGVPCCNPISTQSSGMETLWDSLVVLAVVLEQQTDKMPYQIMATLIGHLYADLPRR